MDKDNNELKNKVLEKAKFYFERKLTAHILIIPTGFRNGIFKSNLIEDTFYWFFDSRENKEVRLFLGEIFDVEDYIEKGDENGNNT